LLVCAKFICTKPLLQLSIYCIYVEDANYLLGLGRFQLQEKFLPAVGPVRAWGAVSNLEFELRHKPCEFQIRPVACATCTASKNFLATSS